MRIIRGKYKGRKIQPPKNFKARPTTDFAKEGLFNILINRIDITDCKVLDLFAGTGNITYEFASRGAKSIVCVEKDFNHQKFIAKTLEELNFDNPVKSVRANAFTFLNTYTHMKFDLVFADPPYQLERTEKLPDLLFASELLEPHAIFILEHDQHKNFSSHPKFSELRTYGKVHFSFFKNNLENS